MAAITGDPTRIGLPSAAAVGGAALGSSLLSAAVPRYGCRPAFLAAFLAAALGGATAATAVAVGSMSLLVGGMLLMGLGQAASQLGRYVAADLYPPSRRGAVVGWIVGAGTVGSVVGPNAVTPAAALAARAGLPDLAGAFLVTVTAFAGAFVLYLLALRPDPRTLAVPAEPASAAALPVSLREELAKPRVRLAVVALVTAQAVMVLIMTATPLHMHHHGHGLGMVGLTMSAHTFGMFAFSPVTGWLADRFGRLRIVVLGQLLLGVSAAAASFAPGDRAPGLVFALFLLGVGWNFGFVSSSALLADSVSPDTRVAVQGRADALTWTSSALASLCSGVLFKAIDYPWTALLGMALLAAPLVVLVGQRRRARFAPA